MRAKTKIVTSIIALILSCVLLFAVVVINNNTNTTVNADAKVRTVELSNDYFDDQSIFDDFDEHELQTDESGFELVAKKSFDMSLFSEMDLVGLDETEDSVTVRYEVQYIESEDGVLLTVTIEGNEEIPVVETIPGLLTYNVAGEPDVMFVVDGEYLWLSELNDAGLVDNVGLFSWLKKAIKTTVLTVTYAITKLLQPAIRFISDVTVTLGGAGAVNAGAALLNMKKDENGIYHANFDCWQSIFGYNDFYDTVFNAATSMLSDKFDYDTTGDGISDYLIWVWKGDYLTLGAGAELGIYKRWGLSGEIWVVDKSQAMTMTLRLDYNNTNIINWQPSEKQWWITGFDWTKQHVNRNDLKAHFTVKFNDSNTYNNFINKWNSRWVKEGNLTVSLNF